MRPRVAIVFNEPVSSRYDLMGEQKAVLGVLDEVKAVSQALEELGYPAFRVPLTPPLESARKTLEKLSADLVFNLFEGFDGQPQTEALVADMLSEFGLPHTGCPGKVLALALDKSRTKALLESHGVATPRSRLVNAQTLSMFDLPLPCIVKPVGEDASHGLSEQSVVNDMPSLGRQVLLISKRYGGRALVEEFLPGREFNATGLGNNHPVVLPISEIVYTLPPGVPPILTFAAKWEPDSEYYRGTNAICPARISDIERKQITAIVLPTYRALECKGYARVDMRYSKDGQLKVIEVNPNPDISPETGAARQAKAAGMSYNEFIEKIVLLALQGD